MIESIYKIVCSQSDICYVGSTFNLLKHRMNEHRFNFKRWDENKTTSEIAIYPYFQKYGPYECKIMLIKQYEVADRSQLLAYETLSINKSKRNCVNKIPPFALLKRQRQKENSKKYWEANKVDLNEKNKRYNELHKERLVEKVTFKCGSQYQLRGRTNHLKSKKHTAWASTH